MCKISFALESEKNSQSNRMEILSGNKDNPWTAQLIFTYLGSSLNKPISKYTPNPGNYVPPPVVVLFGTVGIRYRFDEEGKSILGGGTGASTQTPFHGPKNTTLSDPYIDFTHFNKIGRFHHRTNFGVGYLTNYQYHHKYGYRFDIALNEEFIYLLSNGLTFGSVLMLHFNTFDYSKSYDLHEQARYEIWVEPFIEYRLSPKFNMKLNTDFVWLNLRDTKSKFTYFRPEVMQGLGVEWLITKRFYLFPHIKYFPFSNNLGLKSTIMNVNFIINLL